MNEKLELLERADSTHVTRRTVVKTGAKLAYAVPLVAASFKLSGHSAQAVSLVTGFCGHSVEGDPRVDGGCKAACTDGCAGAGGVCEEACREQAGCNVGQGNDNPCNCAEACNPDYWTCVPRSGSTPPVVTFAGCPA